jgi:hypothetical protein
MPRLELYTFRFRATLTVMEWCSRRRHLWDAPQS